MVLRGPSYVTGKKLRVARKYPKGLLSGTAGVQTSLNVPNEPPLLKMFRARIPTCPRNKNGTSSRAVCVIHPKKTQAKQLQRVATHLGKSYCQMKYTKNFPSPR
jgi:hypothetical protein